MEGDISLLSIPDLLQMICLGGYNRDIHLFDGPTQLGVIGIRNGHIDRCFGFGMWGEAAFFKLVQLCRGRYKVNDAQDMSASDATLTAYSWQELLMEAARRQDEEAQVLQASATGRVIAFPSPVSHAVTYEAPVTRTVAVPSAVPLADTLDSVSSGAVMTVVMDEHPSAGSPPRDIQQLLEEATASYLRRDLARAEALLQQCLVLHPGDKRALQNLERIRRKKTS
jgi:Domain of unknown function (DUF4388)